MLNPRLVVFNKPFGVVCQFSKHPKHPSLSDFVDVRGVYPAGRLDTDSEGLLLLTSDGALQHAISDPRSRLRKLYWAQVEGNVSDAALDDLRGGLDLGDFRSRPCSARRIPEPDDLWSREPPIRFRQSIPTAWLEIGLTEGKNRQVRRMTAKVGLPTLRLVRHSIGPIALGGLAPGEWRELDPALLALSPRLTPRN